MRLDESVLDEARRLAAERRTTLTALLDQALRELLARAREKPAPIPVRLPTFRGSGLQPGVDLDDTASLIELMEASDASH